MKKLNNSNYNTCSTCMIVFYARARYVGGVIGSKEPEAEDANGTLRKWKIKAGKGMCALKATAEEDVLEHMRDVTTPKKAGDTFAKLFSKKNDTRLQLLESELLSIAQYNMTFAE